MATQQVLVNRRVQVEARLTLGIALACAAAFSVLVVLPYATSDMPSAVGAVSPLGFMIGALLAPVAAGACGYASFVALWLHGGALPTAARRMHLATLLVAVLFLAFFTTWGAHALSGWAD